MLSADNAETYRQALRSGSVRRRQGSIKTISTYLLIRSTASSS